jgi:ABC-type uncharacterized transport system substrate-binding protein
MKSRVIALPALAAFLLLVFPQLSLSHPHVFIQNTLAIIFDHQGLAGIRVKWVFDEFFSSMIVGDYDQNHNNKLENSEVKTIKMEAFANLANYEYFTFIRIQGKRFKVEYVRDFSAALAGGKLVYEFLIPCHVKSSPTFKELIISQYDPTYYSRVAFDKDQPVKVISEPRFQISYRIAKNMNESYYFGQVHPVEVITRFRQKHD